MRWPRSPAKNRPSGRPPLAPRGSASRRRRGPAPRRRRRNQKAASPPSQTRRSAGRTRPARSRACARPARRASRSNIAQSCSRCFPPIRVLRPSRATSRYSSQLRSFQASTTSVHSFEQEVRRELVRLRLFAAASRSRRLISASRRDVGCAEALSVKASRQIVDRLHRDAAGDGRLVADEMAELGRATRWRALVENVVSSTRGSRMRRARWTARCSATIVLPVPAEPETRAGPLKARSTRARCAGMQKNRPLLPRDTRARAPAPRHWSARGIAAARRDARRDRPQRAAPGRLAASRQRRAAGSPPAPPAAGDVMTSNRLSSSAARTSSTHSSGTPKAISSNFRRFANSFGFGKAGVGTKGSGSAGWCRTRSPSIALANLDELHRARRRVALDFAALGPFVGVVVMIDVDEQKTRSRFVDDQADVGVDAHRPEIRVLGAIELMELHARRCRVELKVERRRLHSLLLLRRQARERIGECVGDAEFHRLSLCSCQCCRGFFAWRHAGPARRFARFHPTIPEIFECAC